MPKKIVKDKPHKGDPKFIANVQAGWNAKAGRWFEANGKFSTREKVLAANIAKPENYGGKVNFRIPTPITSSFEILETTMFNGEADVPMAGVGGVLNAITQSTVGYRNQMSASYDRSVSKWENDRRNKMMGVQGFDKTPEDKPVPNFMPVQIQTKYSLAEHYYNTDGDVANITDAPIELLSRRIDVICSDKRLRTEVETFIHSHNLESIMSELWSIMREYGQSYPFEVWDDPDNPKELIDIIPLPPKSVHIGYNWAYGLSPNYVGANAWSQSLLNSVFPPAMFRVLMRHWDDSPMYEIPAGGVLLPGTNLRPLFDRRRSYLRYSMPPISRVFRELVDRTIYQDSVRALVEGYKYQLWVVKVGDADHIPLPQEIAAVKDMMNGIAGDRTGTLVWRDAPFTVEVHAPKGLQEMLSNDYYGGLTREILRKMGITAQVIDGETPGTLGSVGGRGSASEKGDINVQLFFEKARYQAKQVTDWLYYLVEKWVRYNSAGRKLPVKALDALSFDFAPTYAEMAGRIKEIYGPMYRDGALSHHTYTRAAGLKGDIELDYKEEETPAREKGLLNPPVTFSQMVVNAKGDTKEVAQTEPKGSPDAAGEQNNAAQDRGTVSKMKGEEEYRPPEIHVHMAEQPAPVVNVGAPIVNMPEQQPTTINVAASEIPAPNVTVNNEISQPTFSPKIIVNPPSVQVAPPYVNVNVPEAQPPVINVAAPNVTVEAAQINVPEQPAPVVNVEAPNVTVEAPNVTVEAAQIHVEAPDPIAPNVHVNIPAAQPIIHVDAPEVHITNEVNPTPVTVENEIVLPEKKDKKIKFKYDRDGNIIGAEPESE